MGTIEIHEFVSLDGVFEDPRWTGPFGFTEGMGAAIADLTAASTAILLGRRTWEMFWPAWSTRTADDDPGAPFFNDTTKYVVSSTLNSVDEWQNSQLLGPYEADAIRALKESIDGKVFVSGSGSLVRGLLADGLVDELFLTLTPVITGDEEELSIVSGGRLPELSSFSLRWVLRSGDELFLRYAMAG